MAEPVRLNKYVAHQLGISRREADARIEQGRVHINGKVATLGNIVTPGRDTISIDKTTLQNAPKRSTYVLMNKPVGYVCSRKQQGASPTIYDLLPHHMQHLKVAGRLDKDSQGLLLLTDDGDMIFRLTHPKFAKQKIYEVGLNKPLNETARRQIEAGVVLEDGKSAFEVTPLASRRLPNRYKVVMYEGRNRQIRRTFKALGYSVTHLERTKFGPYTLNQLTDHQYLQI